jgi:RNA polymerase sigma-70 factor (ECF subfamily)
MSAGTEYVAAEGPFAHDIVALIASGDRHAEQEFARQFERGIRALVRRHCRQGDAVVDDLVQDILQRVLERLRAGAVRSATALPAYIQSAVLHAVYSEHRSRRPTEDVEAIDFIADGLTPLDHAVSAQRSSLLRTLLGELPVLRDREILRRFYLVEQDKEVVCRELNIDESHFHRVLFRARDRFRDLLEQAGIFEA